MIRNERQRFQQKRNERNTRDAQGRGQKNGPPRHRYNLRPRNDNNNELDDDVNQVDEDDEYCDGSMSEGAYSNDDGTDDDINAISDDAPASNVNSTTTVLIIDSSKKKKRLKGLFDSGAGGQSCKTFGSKECTPHY